MRKIVLSPVKQESIQELVMMRLSVLSDIKIKLSYHYITLENFQSKV